jgi:phosphoribosylanthranilate isomerase
MRVKICGITSLDQAMAIAQLGATDLGFICVPQSPRYIDPQAIAAITQGLEAGAIAVGTVGVFVDASAELISTIVHQTGLKTIQLHGQETLETCRELRHRLPNTEFIKAIRVRKPQDLDRACSYAATVHALLLDAYHPQHHGGTGLTLDWTTLLNFRPGCPWLLAGGINPHNIQTALAQAAPDGIDLSSGVEQSPGVKDLTLVKALFQQLATRPAQPGVQTAEL